MLVKRLSIIALCLGVVIGAAYIFRAEIVLAGIKVMVEQRGPIGEHREIEWQRGPDTPPTDPRKPNNAKHSNHS